MTPRIGIVKRVVALVALGCLPLGLASCGPDDTGTNGDGGVNANTDGGGTGDDGGSPQDGGGIPDQIQLIGTLRDFQSSHPDFEAELGAETGIVEQDLGTDGKPVYAGGSGTTTTHGADAFNQWYNDTPGINQTLQYGIVLDRQPNGVYTYDNQAFFPIDGQLFGDEGNPHNYHFTYEINTEFTYLGGEIFSFTGDDDLFVFINGRLAIDLGGVHGPMNAEVNLDDQATALGIVAGNIYTLDFFFAERHTTHSTFRIDTTIANLIPIVQ